MCGGKRDSRALRGSASRTAVNPVSAGGAGVTAQAAGGGQNHGESVVRAGDHGRTLQLGRRSRGGAGSGGAGAAEPGGGVCFPRG